MPGLEYFALKFHEETKHSEFSVRTSSHYLDWENRPSPFKRYRKLSSIPLPHNFPQPSKPSLETITSFPLVDANRTVNLKALAEILFFSAGITRKMRTRAGTYYMRAAPATGALYPIELYVVCRGIPGLAAGVYHFNPLDFHLVKLRDGDYSADLAAACGQSSLVTPLTILLTSLAWRNAWKYEARSYRHWFWDSGAIASNLLAALSSENLPVRIDVGFVDPQVNRLLGLVAGKEATVALAQIGPGLPQNADRSTRETSPLELDLDPVSKEEVEYPLIWETNQQSELHSAEEVEAWKRSLKPSHQQDRPRSLAFRLQHSLAEDSAPTLGEVILRRGSTRRFTPAPVSFNHLSVITQSSTSQIPLDFLTGADSLIDFYFIANQVEGLPSGSYFFDLETDSFEQLRAGRFRDMAGYLCLQQPLFSDASVVFFLMTDLGRVLGSLGNRGYRAAQFEAGIRAGKIYLSSYSLGIGASGSTFYDDAVTGFFSPHAEEKSTMIAVGIGVPAYKARPGRIIVPKRTSQENPR